MEILTVTGMWMAPMRLYSKRTLAEVQSTPVSNAHRCHAATSNRCKQFLFPSLSYIGSDGKQVLIEIDK